MCVCVCVSKGVFMDVNGKEWNVYASYVFFFLFLAADGVFLFIALLKKRKNSSVVRQVWFGCFKSSTDS